MNINELLNNILQISQQNQGISGRGLDKKLQEILNGYQNHNPLKNAFNDPDLIKKLGGGALAVGVLSLLLGGKDNNKRSVSGSIMRMGSLAAIGTLAYQALQNWQENQSHNAPLNQPSSNRAAQEAERNSRIILKAMIAAAQANGVIDDAERAMILQQIGAVEDEQTQRWLAHALNYPVTPQAIAEEVGQDPVLASEVYLTSRVICGTLDQQEIDYLQQLQGALGLDEQFVKQLEARAGF